jgi:hypothetical protein
MCDVQYRLDATNTRIDEVMIYNVSSAAQAVAAGSAWPGATGSSEFAASSTDGFGSGMALRPLAL